MDIMKRMADRKYYNREELFDLMKRNVAALDFLYKREKGYHGHICPKNMVTDGVSKKRLNH